jgi:hypothetical protein
MATPKPTTRTGAVRILIERPGRRPQVEIEPITVGIPFPAGELRAPDALRLCGPDGEPVPVQGRALERWADGSVRWALVDFQSTAADPSSCYALTWSARPPVAASSPIEVIERPGEVAVNTGAARFIVRTGGAFPFAHASIDGRDIVDASRSRLTAQDDRGRPLVARLDRVSIEESGALRSVVAASGHFVRGRRSVLDLIVRLHFFAGLTTVRAVVTVRNPRPAAHRGGFWELGDAGSILLEDLSLTVALPPGAAAEACCSPEPSLPFATADGRIELYQDSSGGANWQSRTHVDRDGQVAMRIQGYRLRDDRGERLGTRATPHAAVLSAGASVGIAMSAFWENFPKAIEAGAGEVVVRLWPHQHAGLHEIQGGEQKTHVLHVDVGDGGLRPLSWCRVPAVARAEPEWYAEAAATAYLSPASASADRTYLQLIEAAIEGPHSFAAKRELIDEYGWRHFGDLYADHEAVNHTGPEPLVSHYNNQYDAVGAFATQFMRTGDSRWRALMEDLAHHVVDIDTYHTDGDKAAYNHAMFWHTCHYVEAGRSTHRSYPHAPTVGGGGPSNEHNYSTGLALHYLMTGDPLSRETVIGLARWVVAMDDGARTPFRWLARGDTGLASQTRSETYQGPGRGAGYSIRTLLDGHRLSGDGAFLTKAEQLIRRTIHPSDALDDDGLLDREQRWSYTVFLQALGRYLDYKTELGQCDSMYAYGRACLLHYARWMREREYPYLDRPEQLEYPTETWAAQDARKSEVFDLAARYSSESERASFLGKAETFWRYTVDTLASMPSRTLTRPIVLLLGHGLLREHMVRHPGDRAPGVALEAERLDRRSAFEPQKVRAKRRFKWLAPTAASLAIVWWLARFV